MKTCILRGVPSSLRQDGWWLGPMSPAGPETNPPRAAQNPRRYALHALLLGALIAVAQLPWPSSATPLACHTDRHLGFHAAHDLRSLEETHLFGTLL